LVRRVILPKARAFIAQGWDPRSRQQTRRVQTLVGDLLVYLPAQADLKVRNSLAKYVVARAYRFLTKRACARSFGR
jgi:hypothetical protein